MDSLVALFEHEIFKCTKCKEKSLNKTNTLNPYCENNNKVISSEPANFPFNRRQFLIDYLKQIEAVDVMIIGEAPGLDGCGFSGIGFTAEYNAIEDLSLPNYHRSKSYQQEKSAEVVYGVFRRVAEAKGVSVSNLSKRIYMTNVCQCVPLAENSQTAITKPSAEMKNICQKFLKKQINLLRPKVIITLGSHAYERVTKVLQVAEKNGMARKDLKTVTACILNQTTYGVDGILLIPELHPSARAAIKEPAKTLHKDLENRMFKYLLQHIRSN